MTDYYNKSANPANNSPLTSAIIRSEFTAIQSGLSEKLPAITDNGGKILAVNAGETALEAITTTGTGSGVRATSPTLVTPILGTPTSVTLTNATGLPASGVAGTALVAAAIGTTVQAYDADLTTWAGVTPGTGVATALATNVGSAGAFVVNGGVSTKTTAFNAVASARYICDTVTTAAFTATLPGSPAAGDGISFYPGSAWTTNNLTVARNGLNINGVAQDLVCDVTKNFDVTYISVAEGWLVTIKE